MDPRAKTAADLVTPQQLVAIRAIANSNRRYGDDECARFFNQSVRPEELSRSSASRLIDFLKKQGRKTVAA